VNEKSLTQAFGEYLSTVTGARLVHKVGARARADA
jgi:hypothetical protein